MATTQRPTHDAAQAPVTLPSELLDLVSSLLRQKSGLERQLPQLAECKSLTLQQQLGADCRSYLTRMRRDLEELKLQVDDLTKARERAAAASHLSEIEDALTEITANYREAVVKSKQEIDKSMISARELLFQTSAEPGQGRRTTKAEASGEDALMSATSEVTEGLRRTMGLLQSSLDSSLVSNEMLEQQTMTMQMTTDQYSTFSSLLTTSKALITSLKRADVLDRVLLAGAFLFFLLCCLWIVKRRVVDKGLRVAGALGRAAARGGSGKQEIRRNVAEVVDEVSTVATSVATAVTSAFTAASSIYSAKSRSSSTPLQPSSISTPLLNTQLSEPVLASPIATVLSASSSVSSVSSSFATDEDTALPFESPFPSEAESLEPSSALPSPRSSRVPTTTLTEAAIFTPTPSPATVEEASSDPTMTSSDSPTSTSSLVPSPDSQAEGKSPVETVAQSSATPSPSTTVERDVVAAPAETEDTGAPPLASETGRGRDEEDVLSEPDDGYAELPGEQEDVVVPNDEEADFEFSQGVESGNGLEEETEGGEYEESVGDVEDEERRHDEL